MINFHKTNYLCINEIPAIKKLKVLKICVGKEYSPRKVRQNVNKSNVLVFRNGIATEVVL